MGVIESFLQLDYIWIILIVSVVATVLSTFVYKWVTDQKKLKEIKEKAKKQREEMKKYKDDQKKLMEIQQEMLENNMVMMKQSFKPMLYTFIPLILLFYWMSATLAYMPLMPGEQFTVTAFISDSYPGDLSEIRLSSIPNLTIESNPGFEPQKGRAVQWYITADNAGTYNLLVEGDTFKQTKDVLVTSEKKYSPVSSEFKDSQLQKIVVGNKEVKTVFGLNWLWTYIIMSIVFSIVLRKSLGIA